MGKISLSKKTIIVIASVFLAVALIVTGLLVFLGGGAEDGDSENGAFMTRADWIAELGANFGMAEYIQQEPYFADVPQDHGSYAFVQATKEWNVLRNENTFNPNEIATRAFVAETVMIAALQDYDSTCFDKSAEELIQIAHEAGIMESTVADDLMTAHECALIAEAAKNYSLTLTKEEHATVELKDGVIDLRTETDIQVNDDVVTMPENLGSDLKVGSVFIVPGDVNGLAKKVVSVEKKDGQVVVTTQEPEFSEVAEKVDAFFVAGPSSIEDIVPLQDGIEILPLSDEENVANMNPGDATALPLSQTQFLSTGKLSLKGFELKVNLTDGKLTPKASFTDYFSAEWSKQYKQLFGTNVPENAGKIFESTNTKLTTDANGKPKVSTEEKWELGYEITGTVKISDFWIEADVDATELNVKAASCKVHLKVENSLKIKGKLEGKLQFAKVPIPGPLGLSGEVTLYLYVDFNGEVQIGVTVDQTATITYLNGARPKATQDTKYETKFDLSAKIGTGVQVEGILKFFGVGLFDLSVKVGGEVEGKVTLHQAGKDSMICHDISVSAPIVTVSIGKNKTTVLGAAKISAELKLCATKNGLFKPKTCTWAHYEVTSEGAANVKSCTWGTKKPSSENGGTGALGGGGGGGRGEGTSSAGNNSSTTTNNSSTNNSSTNNSSSNNSGGTTTTPTVPNNPGTSGNVIASGQCGSSVTWTLYNSGALVIRGDGEMTNYYNHAEQIPWAAHSSTITEIIIENGVTDIGYSFCNLKNVTKLTLPQSITFFNGDIFADCKALTSINYNGTIRDMLSTRCTNIECVRFSEFTVHCSDGVYIPENLPTPNSGSAEITTPQPCGDGVTWTLSKGVLTISGSGKMDDYDGPWGTSVAPWLSYRNSITKIVVGDYVKKIGSYAFCYLQNVTSVEIGYYYLSEIGEGAFAWCDNLISIELPLNLSSIGPLLFYNCRNLSWFSFCSKVTEMYDSAFRGCFSLYDIYYNGRSDTYESIERIGDWDNWEAGRFGLDAPRDIHTVYGYHFEYGGGFYCSSF